MNGSPTPRDAELIALDDALDGLAEFDARKARVVELRFFIGLSVQETADTLHVSPQNRDAGLEAGPRLAEARDQQRPRPLTVPNRWA